jgi:hypothetical protein
MNDKLQEVAELRAHMEGLPVSVVMHVYSEKTATGNRVFILHPLHFFFTTASHQG